MGLSSSVLAQQRTIEDTLVVTDPTVARSGMWKIGVAAEYWATNTTLDIVDANTGATIGTSTTKLNQSGYNFFAGYGNFTFMATKRSGTGDYNASERGFTYGGPQKQTDEEYTLRWLFPSQRISPYVLLGYARTEVKQDLTLNGGTWSCTGTPNLTETTVYKGPMVGGGAILPFNEKFGMRGDIRLNWNSGEDRLSGTNCNGGTSTGLGYAATVTGYWNIIGGLNAQLGAKMTWLNAGENVPDWFKWGVFGMIGYSVQF
jgi:hypothetical protein